MLLMGAMSLLRWLFVMPIMLNFASDLSIRSLRLPSDILEKKYLDM